MEMNTSDQMTAKKDNSNVEFQPPRHWVGVEELSPGYWQDGAVKEQRAQEFFDKPIETLANLERSSGFNLARRDFLTIMGASMALGTVSCVRRPVHKIIPYVVKPEEVTPGVANFYASTNPHTGSAVLVRVREGRPVKLEGNELSPLTKGKLSASEQAELLSLYDPERLKAPGSRGRGSKSLSQMDWASFDAAIVEKLKRLSANGLSVSILSTEVRSDTTRKLIEEFLSQFKNSSLVEFDPLALDEVAMGQELSYGSAVLPALRLDKADYILSLGADFLGTWPHAVEYSGAWASNRKLNGKEASLSKLVAFESAMSVTGANADERYPVRPGDELKVALAIANALVSQGFAVPADAQGAVSSHTPEAVAKDLGMQEGAAKIRKIASDLSKNRGRSIVIAGGLSSKTTSSLALQVAANLLNSVLGNEGNTIDSSASLPSRSSFAAVQKLVGEMRSGRVGALIVWGANPGYHLAPSTGFQEALQKVGLVVSVDQYDTETAQLSDFVAAENHWLESWGDCRPRKHIYSLQQPVLHPLFETRSFQDMLLGWTKGLSGKAPAESWHDYLKGTWTGSLFKDLGGAGGSSEQFWVKALQDGLIDTTKGKGPSGAARTFRASACSKLPSFKSSTGEGHLLALYPKVSMGDGRLANNAWLQELPDPITTIAWDNYANLGVAAAAKLGLKQNDVVEIVADGVPFELPVNVQPGLHPQTLAVAVGYGRRSVGKVGDGVGVDMYPSVRVSGDLLVFSGQGVTVRRTGRSYKLAQTQWHSQSENRPVINDITLAEYKKDPGTSNHTDPHLRLKEVPSIWPMHDYSKGYQWGMTIDLNACTGCGACTIACQAENNIPVVGRENVRISREMHWIRIDRYYSGSPEQPNVIFQPMLCQHCENAPCETVCPVLATVHSEDGINQQIYNRCVGTRYCSNNCPYKVRRFNFFDHWKSYEGTLNMVWNPEVTVRSRGIMEKCTFCVQRIRDSRDKAVLSGRHIRDGELKTACQQTCPTEAIAFGNINDKYSEVSKLREHPRAFRVLEVLNTRPRISYMTKVRNAEAPSSHGHGAGHGDGH
ncbi:MAG: 4Fe-4S dicluster domain-containing protein [Bdellovibrionales bacterium]|nr:4Fe-4S dicluster domain-containing protein [Bdellovibrionales bacterium]